MLDLLTLGPKFTRPACRTAAAAINRYLLWARARPQQQTRRPPLLLSIDGTDRRTDGRTGGRRDTRPFYDSYCIPRGLRNNLSTNGQIFFLVTLSRYRLYCYATGGQCPCHRINQVVDLTSGFSPGTPYRSRCPLASVMAWLMIY